jgi:hypothetical protein
MAKQQCMHKAERYKMKEEPARRRALWRCLAKWLRRFAAARREDVGVAETERKKKIRQTTYNQSPETENR